MLVTETVKLSLTSVVVIDLSVAILNPKIVRTVVHWFSDHLVNSSSTLHVSVAWETHPDQASGRGGKIATRTPADNNTPT